MLYENTFVLTHHARKRLQQRGIPETAISAIIEFGTRHHAGQGCMAYHVDRRALMYAKHNGKRIDQYRNIACIIAEGRIVVTVEHAPDKPKYWKGGGR